MGSIPLLRVAVAATGVLRQRIDILMFWLRGGVGVEVREYRLRVDRFGSARRSDLALVNRRAAELLYDILMTWVLWEGRDLMAR